MALNEQTQMAFGNAPIRRDPVSGNEVPPGALPSEVRDDIPARLSEGEYVVPADVVKSMGNGSPDEGAKELMGMVDEIRLASNGR